MLFMDACALTDSENCYEEENEMFDADFNEDGDLMKMEIVGTIIGITLCNH